MSDNVYGIRDANIDDLKDRIDELEERVYFAETDAAHFREERNDEMAEAARVRESNKILGERFFILYTERAVLEEERRQLIAELSDTIDANAGMYDHILGYTKDYLKLLDEYEEAAERAEFWENVARAGGSEYANLLDRLSEFVENEVTYTRGEAQKAVDFHSDTLDKYNVMEGRDD
jgi:tetrahydromethanopterin S-methyltransferase subunit G